MDALTRIIKQAGQAPPNPEADAMEAAAHQATGPASMPLIKMPKPGEEEKGTDEGKDAIRMAHELDSKSKEINGLRQQLQEAKFDTMRTQLKADIAQEQTRMRESLRKEQQQMHDKLRDEQKQLDARQSQLKMQEAEIKANNIAEQADHKAKISIEEAQHRAQLDSDVSAHDAEIAKHKADSLMDIAQQTTDMYVKQTEKARSDADKYWADRDKAYKANHPAISPALQNTMNAAMGSVGRVSKSLQKMQADAPFQKVALMRGQDGPALIQGRTYAASPATNTTPSPVTNTRAPDPTQPDPAIQAGEADRFQKWRPADANNLADYAKALATQENELARMQGEHASPQEIQAFKQMHEQSKAEFNSLKQRTEASAKAGDAKAKEMMAQYGDLNDDSGAWWWHEESDLDKLRHQYKNEQEEKGHGWLYRTARGVGQALDFIGGTATQESQRRKAERIYSRRGLQRTMMGGEGTTDAERAAYEAATSRGLNSGWGRDVLEIGGQAALDGLTAAGTVATGGALGAGMKAVTMGGKALVQTGLKQGLKQGIKAGWGAGKEVLKKAPGYTGQIGKGFEENGLKGLREGIKYEWNNAANAVRNAQGFWGKTRTLAGLGGKGFMNAGRTYGKNWKSWDVAMAPFTGGQNRYFDEDGNYKVNPNMYYQNGRGNVDLYNGQQLNGESGDIEESLPELSASEWKRNMQQNGWGNMQKASNVQSFLEKWAADNGPSKSTPALNSLTPKPFKDTEGGDHDSYQHDPIWRRMTERGAYQYPILNTIAPYVEGLLGLKVHPTYNWFANQQERWDPFEYQTKVYDAYNRHMASLGRNKEHGSDMGEAVTDAWAHHVGADQRYGSNYVSPFV